MMHSVELKLHKFLQDAAKGNVRISVETATKIGEDVKDAVLRQFDNTEKRKFRLRMSNIGKPYCQLWFEKNKPEEALPRSNTFAVTMLIGDITEAVLKGLMTEAGIEYGDSDHVILDIGTGKISGSYDMVLDGAIVDIKSASDWSYKNKFESYQTLKDGDAFGYVGQLAGYAKASGLQPGGWLVLNKSTGDFKYVSAELDIEEELAKLKETHDRLEKNEFERCFEPVAEVFNRKETGNTILPKECTFCDFRKSCWPNLIEHPSVMSKAKDPKMVSYISLVNKNEDAH